MDISIKRDGLTLKGTLMKPSGVDKCPIAVIFHGLMGSRNSDMHNAIAQKLLEKNIASVRFDFEGHGESDGDFEEMTIYGELLDAAKIMEYVSSLDFVSDIYITGHSQGGLVGGMTAGFFRERVSKLVLLAPAATIKDDAIRGTCFGKFYDTYNLPDHIEMIDIDGKSYNLGQTYMRIAKTLPIYETTSMFKGKTLIIHGTHDDAVGLIGSERYKECMDNVTLHIIDGETHGLNAFSFDAVVDEVVEFLAN